MGIVNVSITAPDAEWLSTHARDLVESRLAAAANLTASVRSVYRWQGEVREATEAVVVLRTRAELVPAIVERTNAVHPYETVHVVATEIVAADPDYERWVLDQTASPE